MKTLPCPPPISNIEIGVEIDDLILDLLIQPDVSLLKELKTHMIDIAIKIRVKLSFPMQN